MVRPVRRRATLPSQVHTMIEWTTTLRDTVLYLLFLLEVVQTLLLVMIFHRQGSIARAAEDFIEGALMLKSDEEAAPIIARLRKRFPVNVP
jgi:hypothetical protein